MLSIRRAGGELSNARLSGGVLIRLRKTSRRSRKERAVATCTPIKVIQPLCLVAILKHLILCSENRDWPFHISSRKNYMLSLVVCVSGVVRIAIIA